MCQKYIIFNSMKDEYPFIQYLYKSKSITELQLYIHVNILRVNI